jgi:hypothetical protein
MQSSKRLLRVSILALGTMGFGAVACGNNDEPYKPTPAFSGRKASMPPVPQLPTSPIKAGDAFTVYGAIHHLRSSIHSAEVTAKDISIVGFIVESNIETAPKCAVHKTGKKDPEGCVTEIPTFAIADSKGEVKGQKIKVMGWASNFANVFDAMEKYKNLKEPPKELNKDELWGVDIPFPLPAVGAKVKITGKYGVNFSKSSAGIAADPLQGIMTYTKIEVLEEAPEKATFASNDNKAGKK